MGELLILDFDTDFQHHYPVVLEELLPTYLPISTKHNRKTYFGSAFLSWWNHHDTSGGIFLDDGPGSHFWNTYLNQIETIIGMILLIPSQIVFFEIALFIAKRKFI